MPNPILKTNFFYLFLIFLFSIQVVAAQDSTIIDSKIIHTQNQKKRQQPLLFIPASLISYGTIAMLIRKNKEENEFPVQDRNNETSIFLHPDNYFAIVPAAAVFGLQAIGIKGRHTVKEQALLYTMSAGISTAIVYPLKNNLKILRPDRSGYNSFPSGHSAIAFVSAEFLRREYGHLSTWYSVGGYLAATTTAVLRVAKDRHWVSDVAAGAGIGIASTSMSYFIFDKLPIKKSNEKSIVFMPVYSKPFTGIYLVKKI